MVHLTNPICEGGEGEGGEKGKPKNKIDIA